MKTFVKRNDYWIISSLLKIMMLEMLKYIKQFKLQRTHDDTYRITFSGSNQVN